MLAQKVWSSLPKKPLAAALFLFAVPTFGVVTAFGIAPETSLDRIERREIIEALVLPDLNFGLATNESFHYQDKVQRGDTVAAILARLNVRDNVAFDFLRRAPEARNLFQLRPGRTVQVSASGDGELQELRYYFSAEKFLEITRSKEQFFAEEKNYASAPQLVFKSATIRSSLFAATDYAGIPDAIAMQIARIFSTDIDFHMDLRKGDRFSVVYEMNYENGELVRPGRVLAAEFFNDGRSFDAFVFTDEEGNESYYSHDGQNRAKSFLRSPLEFSRVSSGFGSRFHPIFNNWRAHTGADFSAPKGTRIWATADGQVESAGAKGGYGNYIEVRHSGAIVTLYAHLSGLAPGVRRGARVKQGQVIGFVGATGWATGPHLHYEFKIAGVHHNPMRVALPKAMPLPDHLKPAFQLAASRGGDQLELLRAGNFGRFE
jgi:murein DD-endopeptidase MepM/ murein hydrolase activator NlpD